MNTYKKIVSIILATLCVCVSMNAQSGLSCDDPIPLGTNYRTTITGACTRWYKANTFDLPLTVKYYPNDNMAAPDLYMDFSCESGVYGDSIICSLFCADEIGAFSLPYHVSPVWKLDGNNNVYYEVSMGKWYLDLLVQHGISYNVEIIIRTVYYGAGTITLTPDAEFSQCMETDKWLLLGRTLQVEAEDDETYFIAPFANWEEDSVRYIWNGSQPATLVMGTTCDYDPMDGEDDRRVDVKQMSAGVDTVKYSNASIQYYMQYMQNPTNTAKGGIFYVKVVSASSGTLKVEHIPQAPPKGGATLLHYDSITAIPADTNALYAIPHTWKEATLLTVPTDHVFKMHIGITHDFQLPDAIATYQFHANNQGHWLGLTADQMQGLWARSTSHYLYVRFECTEQTTLLPSIWQVPTCLDVKEIVRPSTTVAVEKGSSGAVYYRFYYREWKGGDMTFQWQTDASTCPTFIGDNCSFPTSASNIHVITNETIAESGSWVVPAADVAEWEEYVDENGFLYVRFNPGDAGTMVVSTTAPEEQDPAPIEYPKTTISVICDINPVASGQRLFVFVSTSQSLSLYAGDSDNIASRTPIEMWSQTPEEDHTLELQPGIYTLRGNEEEVRIVVQ